MTHQLTKKLQHLKKKIKQFEEQFEKERNYKVKIETHGHCLLYGSDICVSTDMIDKFILFLC